MEQRIDIAKVAPEPYRGIMAFDRYLGEAGTARSLVHLVRLRMAQIDGCDYTREIWSKNFLEDGGDPGRIEALGNWRNSDSFSERERAALEWAEALAREPGPVPKEAFERARSTFSERELVDLTYAVELAHAWNRILLALGGPTKRRPAEAPAPSSPSDSITWTTEELDVTY